MQKILVATTNSGKLNEYRELLTDLSVTWLTLADVGLAGMDVDETGETFTENALLKAQQYSVAAGLPTLADDSGIVVDALNGAPGVKSARYAPTVSERNAKLLAAIEGVPQEKRTARFVCVIALVTPDGLTLMSEGRVEGHIGNAPRGERGFGYDPLFVLPDGRTIAELSSAEKNRVSHRGVALAKLHPLLSCLITANTSGNTIRE